MNWIRESAVDLFWKLILPSGLITGTSGQSSLLSFSRLQLFCQVEVSCGGCLAPERGLLPCQACANYQYSGGSASPSSFSGYLPPRTQTQAPCNAIYRIADKEAQPRHPFVSSRHPFLLFLRVFSRHHGRSHLGTGTLPLHGR
jgi:hypothetical protein